MVSSVAKRVRQLESKIAPPLGKRHLFTVPADVTDTDTFVRRDAEERGLEIGPEDNFIMLYLVKPDGTRAPRLGNADGRKDLSIFTNVKRVLDS